ncbi:MAG: peptide ABC transporter substrate-binding protein [Chloroflexota bacterium]
MKKILYVLAVVVLLGSLLSGCRPQPPVTSPPTGSGVLNLYGIDPITLDPAICAERISYDYIVQVFSGLVRFDDNLEPVPDIAERWRVSNEGKTYTFYLRHDVKFHDGRPVTARDVKYSWERASRPETKSLNAAAYLGDIVGVKEVLAGTAEEIRGVRAVSDYVLEVTIDAPKAYFLFKLTYPTAFVVEEANVKTGADWWRRPSGTGPFTLEQWVESDVLVLERNDSYYGESAKVDAVVFHLWGGVPMDLYERGEIDVTGVSVDYIDKVKDETSPFYAELTVIPELSVDYIGFDTTKPPFDDVNVRLAFAHALDRNKLVDLVYQNMVPRADGFLPIGMPGFNEELSGLDFDVDKARELIKASRYGDVADLPPITITTSGWGGIIDADLEAIVYQWRENLGVEVKVRQLEPQRYLYHLSEEKDEMFYMSYVADYPYPGALLDVLFYGRSDNNYGGYRNPAVDALLEKARAEPDEGEALALYRQAEQALVTDAAGVPLWWGKNYLLTKPYVKGYKVNALGQVMLNKVSVEGW